MINWNDPISVNSEEFYLDAVFHTSLWTNFRTDLTKLFRESHAFASPHCAPYDVAKQYPKNQKIMCPENVLKNLKHRLIKYSTGTDVRARVASFFGRISLHFFFLNNFVLLILFPLFSFYFSEMISASLFRQLSMLIRRLRSVMINWRVNLKVNFSSIVASQVRTYVEGVKYLKRYRGTVNFEYSTENKVLIASRRSCLTIINKNSFE